MAIAWLRGSQLPTSAELTTIKNQTVANSTPNELEIVLDAYGRKQIRNVAPASEPTIGTVLP